jgi:hypothetical protein
MGEVEPEFPGWMKAQIANQIRSIQAIPPEHELTL